MFDRSVANAINWSRAWLAEIHDLALPLLDGPNWLAAMNDAALRADLRNAQHHPIQFVAQHTLPAGLVYESHIYQTGAVPTRDNLHDFFNALIWLRFPLAKRTLNSLQALELLRTEQLQARGMRGSQRDAATLFDENAALLVCSEPAFVEALKQHQWEEVFFQNRALFKQSCEVILFGHALLEKLVHPYKAITAHAWIINVEPQWHALAAAEKQRWLDKTVAEQLAQGFTAKNFTPLPVLGMPGWWPGQDANFYADRLVFRPAKNA